MIDTFKKTIEDILEGLISHFLYLDLRHSSL